MSIDPRLQHRLGRRLGLLYGTRGEQCLGRVMDLLERYAPGIAPQRKPDWDERDVVLITYGDQVRRAGENPLRTLGTFLRRAGLSRVLSTVHLLPFYPYSSDDGFSVIDYCSVDPALGDWSDVAALGAEYDLMFDLVLNHASRRSRWFSQYAAGVPPYTRYFIEVDPARDLSSVVRPRPLPLLTRVETSRGPRHVWTTFSEDQVDLDYSEPDVLVEMLGVLLEYLRRGARMIRLDAIGYLWKQIGSPCIHLPETHEVVKFLRDVVDAVSPGAILLTETNVPHAENVGYFGHGDEAQMVYQFTLAPLLLEALLTGDATVLTAWLESLEPTLPGTTFFNFTASHDGIGVRPLEGILPHHRQHHLIEAIEARGGLVSTKHNSDGTTGPYELNITYFSALSDPKGSDSRISICRFLASQAIALSMRGIPGIYFHSLVATPNDRTGVEQTGRARSINRRKFHLEELEAILQVAGSAAQAVLEGYRHLLAVRVVQPAFHPEASQVVVPLGQAAMVAFTRTSLDGRQRILVLANVGPQPQTADCSPAGLHPIADLLGGPDDPPPGDVVRLGPYQVAWLIV